jgi:hypothetical protein
VLLLLQVGGDSLRAFATFINPNLVMGRWSFYIIFGAVQLMLSMVRKLLLLLLLGFWREQGNTCYGVISARMWGPLWSGPAATGCTVVGVRLLLCCCWVVPGSVARHVSATCNADKF